MPRLNLGKISIDALTQAQAIHEIDKLVFAGGAVFTANTDHVMQAETNEQFAAAYSRSKLTLADGQPLVWASHLLGTTLPERVAGSDLLMPLLKLASERGLRVFLLGSQTHILRRAIVKAEDKFPDLLIVGHLSPTVSSDVRDWEVSDIMGEVARHNPDIVIVALGAPKQELFIDKALQYCPTAVMLGLGASLDFLAGEVSRAPYWMRSVGLEWLFRLVQEPRRLWKRYLRDLRFPLVVIRQLRG